MPVGLKIQGKTGAKYERHHQGNLQRKTKRENKRLPSGESPNGTRLSKWPSTSSVQRMREGELRKKKFRQKGEKSLGKKKSAVDRDLCETDSGVK